MSNAGGGGGGGGGGFDDEDSDSESDSEEESDDDCDSDSEGASDKDSSPRRTSVAGGTLGALGKKVAAVAAKAARDKHERARRRAERAEEKEARRKDKADRKAAAVAAAAAAKPSSQAPQPKKTNKNGAPPQHPRSAADAEASALRGAASHGCVVGVVGAWRSRRSLRGDLWLVMELCAGGSVADALALMGKGGAAAAAKNAAAGKSGSTRQLSPPPSLISPSDVGPAGGLTEPSIARVVGGALAGIAHIHASGKAHRDIKCGNLLLTARGHVKVADFGVAGEETLFFFFFFSGSGGVEVDN